MRILTGKELRDKITILEKVKVDSTNWLVYYIDCKNKEKWVKRFPNSEYHGGGIAELVEIEKFPWED